MKRKILESLVWGFLVALAFSFAPSENRFLVACVIIIATSIAHWRYFTFMKNPWNRVAALSLLSLVYIGFAMIVSSLKLVPAYEKFTVDLGLRIGVINSGLYMIPFVCTILTLGHLKKIKIDIIGKVLILSLVIVAISLFWHEAGSELEYSLENLGSLGASSWKTKYFLKIKSIHFLKDLICWTALMFVTYPSKMED